MIERIMTMICFKKCSKCGKYKHITRYNNRSKSVDGKQPWCRACFHEYHEKRKCTPEEIRAKKHYVKHFGTFML